MIPLNNSYHRSNGEVLRRAQDDPLHTSHALDAVLARYEIRIRGSLRQGDTKQGELFPLRSDQPFGCGCMGGVDPPYPLISHGDQGEPTEEDL